MEKLHDYQGFTGRLHEYRDSAKERISNWREQSSRPSFQSIFNLFKQSNPNISDQEWQDYSHVYRHKTRAELIRLSAAVMGIEFSYAAETAFVSPTLLKIGVRHQQMTMVWALSPLIGFFLTPLLGSLSDRCRLKIGRRRPFIILLSIGVLIGLMLVPNGEDIGYSLGDTSATSILNSTTTEDDSVISHRISASDLEIKDSTETRGSHSWGIFFTILGTVLLDFDADACQSPSRAYLLDVTVPEDHAKGLSTFTIMAGLGGFMGYSLGGINWDETFIGEFFGGHVRAVFSLITIIFIFCVSFTITSFPEMPLSVLESQPKEVPLENEESVNEITKSVSATSLKGIESKRHSADDQSVLTNNHEVSYGTMQSNHLSVEMPKNLEKRRYTMPPLPLKNDIEATVKETSFTENAPNDVPLHTEQGVESLMYYLRSIVFMPHSLRMVCLTNLFCWSAHVCYSLYFTDFVGEAVFGGDPKALETDIRRDLYEEGVRFGCWGMALYSLSCSCYSLIIERLITKYGARRVYIGGLLFYSFGMTMMALTKHKIGVIVFSWTAGVMYSTLFTMPYLLIANYHNQGVFELNDSGEAKIETKTRGLGTDVAIVSSMVFLAQFILSLCMGSIVSYTGTTTAVVSVASFLSFCGAISATQVIYLDL